MAKQLPGLIVRDSFQGVMVPIPWRSLFALKTKVGDSDPEIISGIWWGILIQNLFQEYIQAQAHEPMRYPAVGSILKLVLIHHQCRCMLYAHTAKHSPVRRKPQKSKVGVSA
jgi:hypothetical protein